jgi:hypothetical protein
VQRFAAFATTVRLEEFGTGAGRQSRSSIAKNFAATLIVRSFGFSRVHFFKEGDLQSPANNIGDCKSPLLDVELAAAV